MDWLTVSPEDWAQQNFGASQLGDKRRNRVLVNLAARMAAQPDGSLPQINELWSDAKATYGLFKADQVTFPAVCTPHWNLRHRCPPGTYLIPSDTTEIDFGKNRKITGVGPLGNGSGQGFLLHSALLVDPNTGELLCQAGGLLVVRLPKSKSKKKRNSGKKLESARWGELIEQIGPPPEGVRWVHIMDREADNFDVFDRSLKQRCDFVIRIRNIKRRVLADPKDEKTQSFQEILAKKPAIHRFEQEIAPKAKTSDAPARSARTAIMEMRTGTIWIPVPSNGKAYRERRGKEPIRVQFVSVREVAPPPGEKAVEWNLYTTLPVDSVADAFVVLSYYEKRWTIEEYHKAIKTGTQIETRRLTTGERLAPLIGLSGIEAVRLVQLKFAARVTPERPAEELVPPIYIAALKAARRRPARSPLTIEKPMTVRDFFRGVAMLGGFLARKRDGEPGWQTTWRGWEKLRLIVRGLEAAKDSS